MLEMLMNPGDMTSGQWMILGILVLLCLAIVFFLYRTWLVIQESRKNPYKPNIGLPRIQGEAQDNSPKDD